MLYFLENHDEQRIASGFFCGRGILACPVLDEGAGDVTVTLPKVPAAGASADGQAASWLLRGSGPPVPGGTTLTLPCLPEDGPVWFLKEGLKL